MVYITMDIRISEGRVYGARYYTAEPLIAWHPTNEWGNIMSWMDLEKWCTNTFGPAGSVWESAESQTPLSVHRWYINGAKFWFREKKDLEWFILKWS